MAGVAVKDDFVAIAVGCKLWVTKRSDSSVVVDYTHEKRTDSEKQEAKEEAKEDEDLDFEVHGSHIIKPIFSPTGQYFATCTNNKNLMVWKTADWTCLLKQNLVKRPTSLLFSHSELFLLVCDKTGDVYRFDINSNNIKVKELQPIMGHLSMLLDMKITQDENYLITADRDEKIRVSCFPNCYNIWSFCLGHTNFVSCIELISMSDQHLLLSVGGDGMMYLWDFFNGKMLDSHSLKKDVAHSLIPRCIACSEERGDVFVSFERSSTVDYFKLENKKLRKLKPLQLTNDSLDLSFGQGDLWVLQNSETKPVMVFRRNKDLDYTEVTEDKLSLISSIQRLNILEDFDSSCWSLNGLRKCGKRNGLESIPKKDSNIFNDIKKQKKVEEKT